jgi:putative membrane protein
MRRPQNVAYQRGRYAVAEWTGDLGADLAALVGPGEAARVLRAANRATQLVALQSAEIADLAARGALEPNRHVALARVLADLYEQQGRCERIKNFPYPRQFASINLFFVRLFVGLVPLGLLGEFQKLGDGAVWLTVPFSAVVGWVFTGLERVGQSTENPFEGSANDVPITALSRTIEIDLREILGEADVPPPLAPERDILM